MYKFANRISIVSGLVVLIIVTMTLFAFNSKKQNDSLILIPYPVSLKKTDGVFQFNNKTKFLVEKTDTAAKNVAQYFIDKIKQATGFEYKIETFKNKIPKTPNAFIIFCKSKIDSLGDEGYLLHVDKSQIIIQSNFYAGAFYAIQTIRQLLPIEFETAKQLKLNNLKIQCLEIFDKPRFQWRGSLLDCGRHFMTKEFVKRYIDLLATYKMNRFHWHLTEDQGWRIEIKKYPLLTTKSAYRKEKDGSTYGGFYSQDDIREVLSYAKMRNVMVIPEIEMPGHCVAALASYPELSCTGDKIDVVSTWGVFNDVYCAGNEKTFEFLQNVIDEVAALFPSPYIHIGGDEVPKNRWSKCPKCQQRIKTENLKNEAELQSYFIKRMAKYLQSKNKILIGWDEILEGGIAPSAIVQSWRGMEGAIEAVNHCNKAICSPTSHAYFDADTKNLDLKKIYFFNPVPDGITAEQTKLIIGGECNMWTEYAPQETIESKVFPRALAIAEVFWSPLKNMNYDNFYARLQNHYAHMDAMNVHYGLESAGISSSINFDTLSKTFKVEMKPGQTGLTIRYSVDNSEPTAKSQMYNGLISIDKSCILKAKAFRNDVPVTETIERNILYHKAVGKKLTLNFPCSPKYAATGNIATIDGLRGTNNFNDGIWQGYSKYNYDAIIDLNQLTDVEEISAGFLQSVPSWIFFPVQVEYFASNDGINFTSLGIVKNDISQHDENLLIKDFTLKFAKQQTRFIKVVAQNVGICPEWHSGASDSAWLFIDEVVVK